MHCHRIVFCAVVAPPARTTRRAGPPVGRLVLAGARARAAHPQALAPSTLVLLRPGPARLPCFKGRARFTAQGDAPAQFNLGVCHERGDGVAQNAALALQWYRKAAAQGVEEAAAVVARLTTASRRAS